MSERISDGRLTDYIVTNKSCHFIEGPKWAGYWEIAGHYGLRISQVHKPRLLTRWLCKALLEWTWHDGPRPGGDA